VSSEHKTTIEKRARKRQFNTHLIGSRRPGGQVGGPSCEMLPQADGEEDEWEDGHIRRREELVKSFAISWERGNAEWLQFPGTKRNK
jgi:hypothetical protein